MTRETCATCRFWLIRTRLPPGGIVGDLPWRYRNRCSRYPQMVERDSDDWCGEHQPVAPAPAASDDYTRAAVRYAEASAVRMNAEEAWITAPQSADTDAFDAAADAEDAAREDFLRLYRERHGG